MQKFYQRLKENQKERARCAFLVLYFGVLAVLLFLARPLLDTTAAVEYSLSVPVPAGVYHTDDSRQFLPVCCKAGPETKTALCGMETADSDAGKRSLSVCHTGICHKQPVPGDEMVLCVVEYRCHFRTFHSRFPLSELHPPRDDFHEHLLFLHESGILLCLSVPRRSVPAHRPVQHCDGGGRSRRLQIRDHR